MAIPTDVAKEAIEETSEVIQTGLKNNPLSFLVFTVVVITGVLYAGNLYLSYLSSKEQIAGNAITMAEQNKVLASGFKQTHEDAIVSQELQRKQIELSQKTFEYTKYGRKSLE